MRAGGASRRGEMIMSQDSLQIRNNSQGSVPLGLRNSAHLAVETCSL